MVDLHLLNRVDGSVEVLKMTSIFEYNDYRRYLKDYYDHQHQQHKYFSYRYISINTGIDASYFVKVLNSKAHLSDKVLPKVIEFLKLNKREKDYFLILVQFNKSKHQEQIKGYLEKLISFREPIAKVLVSETHEFFSKWYYCAVREWINIQPFSGDYSELAARLCPPISAHEAKNAIQLLEKLNLIKKQGRQYQITDRFISTGAAWVSPSIRLFQKHMLELGVESLERFPKEARDISTVTVSISWECFRTMKKRLEEVRKEFLEMAKDDETPQEVFQFNFQVFPMTRASRNSR